MEDLDLLAESNDFAGSEELLSIAMGLMPKHAAFLHFEMGRLYVRWNKMSSAINHFHQAAELAVGDEVLTAQIYSELKSARRKQLAQSP